VHYHVGEDIPRVDNFPPQPRYAVASGINIKVENATDYNRLIGLRISKGFLLTTHKTRETKAYFVQNLSDMDRTFTVDHVVRPGWNRLGDKNEPLPGPEVFRFKLEIEKGKTGNQAVREEHNYTASGVLPKTLPEATIRHYMIQPIASADVKAAFTKALAMQAKIQEKQIELSAV